MSGFEKKLQPIINKKMKVFGILISVILSVFPFTAAFAQDKTVCEKIVEHYIEAVQSNSFEQFEKFLSPDFACLGQKSPIAVTVLKQVSLQAMGEVTDYREISATEENENLTFVYEITAKIGKKETIFIFNKDNQLKQLDISGLQTKIMKSEDTSVEKSEKEIIIVPVQVSEKNLIIAEAKINGATKKFIIDSGAPNLILNSKYVEAGKQDSASKQVISDSKGVNGSVSGMDITKISEFDFYGMKIKNQEVLMMDFSNLEDANDMEIYGLIGYQIYKDYDILFDYENNTLVLIKPELRSVYLENKYAQNKITEIPIEMQAHIPCVKGNIGKREYNLGIDCGAGGNLLNEQLWDILKKQVKDVEKTELGGAGESKNVSSGKLKKLAIGNKTFTQTTTVFNDMSHLNASGKLQIDGLVGYEILSKQKTLISFNSQKLIFIE
jgi:hypothetical protein